MASFAKVMTPDELWDVAMYVRSLAPPMIERDGMRSPVVSIQPVADERLGIEALTRTMPRELATR